MNTRRRETNRIIGLGLVDIILTLLSLYLAAWARYWIPWGVQLPWQFVALPGPVYLMTAFIWPVIFSLTSVYTVRSHTPQRLSAEVYALVLGVGLSLLVLAGVLYFSYREVPRRLFFYFGMMDFGLLIIARMVGYTFRRMTPATNHISRLLIIGAGELGQEIASQVQRHPESWRLVGFVDDAPARLGDQGNRLQLLGSFKQLEAIIVSQNVNEIIIALPFCAHEQLTRMVLDLERLPVEVNVVPDYFNLAFFRTRMDELLGFPLIRLRASAIEGNAWVIKRLFDLVVAIPLLLCILPLFFLIALLIRLDSPGPVLFRQKRVGENGRIFGMWKFRTMRQDAEQLLDEVVQQTSDGQIVHKRPDDPRVTRIGRFLRHHSLDEFPQLINVIKGEMSLVGPRPELPWLVDRYESWQRKRFAAPPGMTGWWQISGRSDRPMHLHIEDDLYYINNYSIWLDLRIIWRTIGVVLSGKGAY